jgi:hypothetical protein
VGSDPRGRGLRGWGLAVGAGVQNRGRASIRGRGWELVRPTVLLRDPKPGLDTHLR